MQVYRISKCRFITDLSGFGAYTFGGRWNSKGTSVVYTAGSGSLALLEALAHIDRPPVGDFCRITISIPDDAILEFPFPDLPSSWQDHPAPDLLKTVGDTFVAEARALALKLPSVIMPDEFNYLINPAHPHFRELTILESAAYEIDHRLL